MAALANKLPPHMFSYFSSQRCLLLLLVMGLLVPLVLNNQYWLYIAVQAMVYTMLALGLNAIISCGLLDLGYIAFFAIGAYIYAILNTWYGLSFWAVIPITILISFFSGLVLSFISLQSRSDYFALLTLAFGEIIRLFIRNSDALTNGPQGIMGITRPRFFISIETPRQFYYFALALLISLLFVIHKTLLSRLGAAWAAVRQNENWLLSTGYNTLTIRSSACIVGAVFAGIGGTFFAAWQTFVAPESFTFFESIFVLCMVILGSGTNGNLAGVFLGAFILALLPEWSREVQEYRMLVVGAGMTAIAVIRPRGIFSESWELRADSSLFWSVNKSKAESPQSDRATQNFNELRIVSLKKTYGGIRALGVNGSNNAGFTFTFKRNQIYGIIGLNGAGKTTLFNCIRGFVIPDGGTITLDKVSIYQEMSSDINSLATRLARFFQPHTVRKLAFRNARYIASTFQTCSTLEDLPAWKNVYLALKPITGPCDAMRELVDTISISGRAKRIMLKDKAKNFLIDSFDFPVEDLERSVAELSFAKRRIIEVAKAFATNRPIVLLDEPTAGLDEEEQLQLSAKIKQLSKERIIIMIEHNYRLLQELADVVLFMDEGQVGKDKIGDIVGNYDDVMSREVVRQSYLGETLIESRPHVATVNTPPALEVSIKSVCYSSGAPILRDIEIIVPRGAITALIGANGAGKSTLLKSIMNSPEILSLDAIINLCVNGGTKTLVDYKRNLSMPTHAIAEAGVIFLRQENKLFESMTVKENLEFALSVRKRKRDQCNDQDAVNWFLENLFASAFSAACDKKKLLSRNATELSGGQQQILALGRALLMCGVFPGFRQSNGNGYIFLLDEPMAGLQPSLCRLVLKTIQVLKEQHGITFLVAEQRDALKDFADCVILIENGRIIEGDNPAAKETSVRIGLGSGRRSPGLR